MSELAANEEQQQSSVLLNDDNALAKAAQLPHRDSMYSGASQNGDNSNGNGSSSSSEESAGSDDEQSDSDQFFETSQDVRVADTQDTIQQSSSSSSSQSPALQTSCPNVPPVSVIPGTTPHDPLQKGVELAMKAVWLFMDSDFEQVEVLLHHKRHNLLYASEGYAAIQYLRAMMTFTKEAMNEAQTAAENTINLTTYFRKPRGVSALLSGPGSRAASRSGSPQAQTESQSSQGSYHRKRSFRSAEKPTPNQSSEYESAGGSHKQSERHHRFRLDSPRLPFRMKKSRDPSKSRDSSASTPGSMVRIDSATFPRGEQPFDESMLDAKYRDLENLDDASDDNQTFGSTADGDSGAEERLDKPVQRSWTSGLTSVADSLIGVVRAGTQAVGISKPDWHILKTMTPTQRHAELVHAEAYLLRAVLNIAMGDGVMALLKESWHVRSAYATYRGCYAYIQDAHADGETIDDHFVSGTYLGMGVFNLILSMMPARLLRFIELVGFSADRKLGLELLAIAAGWRTDPLTKDLMGPPPKISDVNGRPRSGSATIHPCGVGLRSEFCSLVLQFYHILLCNELYLGYPNQPLVDAVLRRSIQQHPKSLIFMYLDGRSLMTRRCLTEAISRYDGLIKSGKGAVKSMQLAGGGQAEASPGSLGEDSLVAELSTLSISDTANEETKSPTLAAGVGGEEAAGPKEWRQLQYLGYWERSLCLMALGRWLEAAEGFNTLRKENNWNKAVYTYALAVCMWEHYLTVCNGVAPIEKSELDPAHKGLLKIVRQLMKLVPTLKRKVAGKSIPVEKFVMRKARKFKEQGDFLMRPGLELLHVWGLYGKMPRKRLVALRSEIDREVQHMSEFVPTQRAPENPYRHIFYYDDLALLLLTKGCVLRELAYPSYLHSQPSTNEGGERACDPIPGEAGSPELAPIAEDTLLRLLRLMPLIQRDHYQAVSGRFHLANLYLAIQSSDARRREWAFAQWRCILSGKPLSSPPCLSFDEYHAIIEDVSSLQGDSKGPQDDRIFAAPTCLIEEVILEGSGHSSLQFYDGNSQISDWHWMPPYWADSKKYSLENILEVRTFNADSRLKEALLKE